MNIWGNAHFARCPYSWMVSLNRKENTANVKRSVCGATTLTAWLILLALLHANLAEIHFRANRALSVDAKHGSLPGSLAETSC